MNKIVLAYITNPTREKAIELANHLIKKELIGCGNIFPIESIYVWDNKQCLEKEYILIAKTTPQQFDLLKKEIETIHPYKIPCILKIEAEANKAYFDWLSSGIKKT